MTNVTSYVIRKSFAVSILRVNTSGVRVAVLVGSYCLVFSLFFLFCGGL